MPDVNLVPAQTLRLSDRQLKGVKPASKDYVLTDGDGLQLRVRSNGSLLWNFNYREPVTKNRINMGLGTYPELSLALKVGIPQRIGFSASLVGVADGGRLAQG